MGMARAPNLCSVRSALRSTGTDEINRRAQVFDLLATPPDGGRELRAVTGPRQELRVLADRPFGVLDEPAIAFALAVILERTGGSGPSVRELWDRTRCLIEGGGPGRALESD